MENSSYASNQTPCKIGFSELDKQKYELHIKTTTRAIEITKLRGRENIAENNEKTYNHVKAF